jgi:NAD+ synthase (glutamine-hydrolysing)
LFTPSAPHIKLSLAGVQVITNGSASHHEFRKLQRRVDLICEATLKCGGIYLYANQQGCDGERVYYDGSAMIIVNGAVLGQSSQFSLNDVEVVVATVDLDEVVAYRAGIVSRGMQASKSPIIPIISCRDIECSSKCEQLSAPIAIKYHSPEEEIRFGPACWLWDYLVRSKQGGFFLPLSGGIDSCSTALIVFSMCEMVYKHIEKGDLTILSDLRRIVRNPNFEPNSPQEICGYCFPKSFCFFAHAIWEQIILDLIHEIVLES